VRIFTLNPFQRRHSSPVLLFLRCDRNKKERYCSYANCCIRCNKCHALAPFAGRN